MQKKSEIVMQKRKLGIKQKLAILNLLSSPSIREAADASNVSERTLYRWLKNPHFLQELKEYEDQLMKDASRRLLYLAGKAIDVTSEILQNPDSSDSARLRSAKIIFDQMLKIKGLIEIKEEVDRLEELIDEYVKE